MPEQDPGLPTCSQASESESVFHIPVPGAESASDTTRGRTPRCHRQAQDSPSMGRIKLKPCLVGQEIKWGKRMRVTTTTRGRQQRSFTHFTRFPGPPIQGEGGDHLDGSQTRPSPTAACQTSRAPALRPCSGILFRFAVFPFRRRSRAAVYTATHTVSWHRSSNS